MRTLLAAAAASLILSASANAALVAHWNFDEGTGTTAANAVNAAFNGTVAGGAAWVAGPAGFGNALAFDGADDQVNTTWTGLTGTVVRSVTAWIKYPNQPGGSPNEFDAILSYGNNTTSQRWTMRVSDTAAVTAYRLRLEVAGGGVYGSTNLNDDLWHHVAIVQTGGTLGSVMLYVDGVAETLSYNGGGAALAINTTVGVTTPVILGASGHGTNYNFLGTIDDVRVYDAPLSQADIQGVMVPEPGAGLLALGGALLLRRRRR